MCRRYVVLIMASYYNKQVGAGECGWVRLVGGRRADLFELYCIWIMASYIIENRLETDQTNKGI